MGDDRRRKPSNKPNIFRYPIGTASVYARFREDHQMTTQSKVSIRWAFWQFFGECIKYGYITKKEILNELEIIVYIDKGQKSGKDYEKKKEAEQ